MLLTFCIISHLAILTVANPFHKYPFVFLLDVGNEELKNTNTDQIRISAPGGSLALRYPAIGNGDIIAHVRVSGIDFGTDLKANILDGGPGYKYVVLVFMGNPGAPYDAVLTVQTVSNDGENNNEEAAVTEPTYVSNENNGYKVSEVPSDNNNAVIDNTIDSPQNPTYKTNAEIIQSQGSSDSYTYEEHQDIANDNVDNGDGEETDECGDDNDSDNKKYNNQESQETSYERYDSQYDGEQNDNAESAETYDAPEQNEIAISEDNPKAAPYSINNENNNIDDDNNDGEQSVGIVDKNLYNKYEALKPHLYDGVKIYPQKTGEEEIESSKGEFEEDPVEIDQMFNDEEVHNDAEKFKDTNNNYFDSDDSSAVAY